MKLLLSILCFVCSLIPVWAQPNPDQITVFFPAFGGENTLGRNVSTILSLQLAQTTRKAPWPDNPDKLDFGRGMIKWSADSLNLTQQPTAIRLAQQTKLLAQMVVLGNTQRFGSNVVVEVEVLLPHYQAAYPGCTNQSSLPCDYRKQNFELWPLQCQQQTLYTPLPRRRYHMAGIVLEDEVVKKFREVKGLPITAALNNPQIIGYTGEDLQFLEFNRQLTHAPTKLRSQGVEGYVSLPKISQQNSEFADMTGGLLQLFRGDWQAADSSFSRVLANPVTRIPLQIDAYLLRGMAQFRQGGNGLADIEKAASLAPFDAGAARYQLVAMLAAARPKAQINQTMQQKRFLFDTDDAWLQAFDRLMLCSNAAR
ncbi:hypothetical protein [Rheinheimera maricola]|uniref:Tetratricopeptide repeat protein n=1 Tax=Rheinheimera maricola TaxID=2793282 RepID=A0ABS7X4S9_9GAMM|nr:hypothetical protein [Rheinheimera maricola]MBZ9610538.1 hypothetical protein [Rheinheimera maricola]